MPELRPYPLTCCFPVEGGHHVGEYRGVEACVDLRSARAPRSHRALIEAFGAAVITSTRRPQRWGADDE